MNKEEKIEFILQHPELTNRQLADALGYASERSLRRFRSTNCLPSKSTTPQNTDLEDKIKKRIKNCGRTVEELADAFAVGEEDIEHAVDNMLDNHFIVNNFDGNLQMGKAIAHTPKKVVRGNWDEVEYSIGIISDTHICSKYERLDLLEEIYDRFEHAGVEIVYHGGNWIDGDASFNQNDLIVHGMRNQVQYFVENYPERHGIKTYILSGDDHCGWYVQKTNINIGEYLEDIAKRNGRNDLFDLGYMERDIEYKQAEGSSNIRVIHGGGGSSAATSAAAQKYIEMLGEKEKPSIVIIGHYHRLFYSNHKNIHLIQAGCVVDLNPFARKKKFTHDIGACIMHVKQNRQGVFTSVKMEFITFDDRTNFEYKW